MAFLCHFFVIQMLINLLDKNANKAVFYRVHYNVRFVRSDVALTTSMEIIRLIFLGSGSGFSYYILLERNFSS